MCPWQKPSGLLAMVLQSVEEMAPLDQQLEKEHQEKTKVKNIEVRATAANHWVRPVATAELQCHSGSVMRRHGSSPVQLNASMSGAGGLAVSLTACQISTPVDLSTLVHLQWVQLGLHETATRC